MKRPTITILATGLTALALAACGSSSKTTSTGTSTTTSTSTSAVSTGAAGAPPRRIARIGGVAGVKATPARLVRVSPPTPTHLHAHLTGLDGLSFSQKLGALSSQTAQLWQIAFNRAGAQLPPVNVYLVDGAPATCGSTQITSDSGPEYCPSDGSIYLTAGFLQSRIVPLGDAALLLMISDLYGLHVENALGVLGSLSPAQVQLTDSCFSGISFDYAQYKHQLQPADEAVVNKLLALEAPVAGSGGGTGAVTADQLTTAFNQGLLAGISFKKCLPAGSA